MLESDYIHAEPLKAPPPVPVRVSRKSQLMAAFTQNVRQMDRQLTAAYYSCVRVFHERGGRLH